ncbi:MAG TPA: hypothetical protein DCQ34_01145 [Chitinophagaceae bacterium]|nr:hypothetical protein [Chitinophagaceae bacterium]
MNRIFTLIVLLGLAIHSGDVSAQSKVWSDIQESSARVAGLERVIIPNKFRMLELDTTGFLHQLRSAPEEFSQSVYNNPLIISLPMPDGGTQRFRVSEYSMMEPALQQKFPDIRTYNAQGIDDPSATAKLDWTGFGFHAMILSAHSESVWIDPYVRGNKTYYMSYKKSDLNPRTFMEHEPLVDESTQTGMTTSRVTGGPCVAGQIRSYRLAVACTGEYAVAVGGTNATLLHSAIVTSVNRVNGLYEKELSIRLVLIGNNNLIEYLDAATDPFTGNNVATTLINESQVVINANIGAANYDIGHTFCTGGGGLAQLASVCATNFKARGITGLPNPVGDAFDIDFVCHEIGHQFGSPHTFNAATGNCGGNGSTVSNAEPGSGSTIMGYAGICTSTNDLQLNSDPHFHAISYDLITNFSRTGGGASCGTLLNTGNNAPVVNAGSSFTIPINTAFTLTGSATDPDGDPLTYSWEQINVGGPFSNWNTPSGNAPIFRSFVPTSTPVRTFPRWFDIANNTTTIGEILPSYARTLSFRLTARDNRAGGGGVCYAETSVIVSGTTAFTVTSQNTATNWVANGTNTATIAWNVASTTGAPFNVANVDILFSADGGFTFPYTLVSNTPNDGTQIITIPSIPTIRGRVMVKSRGNIFFDVNTGFITITSSCSAEGAIVSPANTVNTTAGNAALNLGLSPQYSTPFSPAGSLEVTDPATSLAVYNSSTFACQLFSNQMRYDTYTFTPSITATYTFTLTGSFPTIMNLYNNSFVPDNPCSNFVRSNGTFNGVSVAIGTTVTQALIAGNTYTLVIGTFSATQPTLPAPYSVAVSSASPVGGVIYAGTAFYNNPGAGFSYTYIVVNNATGNIQGISATSNLTNSSTYPAGSYTVYGLSYSNSIGNLNTFIGGSFSNLTNSVFNNPSGFCANLSKNVVQVNIAAGPVPVRRLELSARRQDRKSLLTWITEEEQNTSLFLVQRSKNGNQFDERLGQVAASGNSQGIRTYQFTDERPLSGWNYYRIEAVDIDAARTFSNTVALQYDGAGNPVLVYPNPASNWVLVDQTIAQAGRMTWSVLDGKGAVVARGSKWVTNGPDRTQISLESLPAGVYILQYQVPGQQAAYVKVVKR